MWGTIVGGTNCNFSILSTQNSTYAGDNGYSAINYSVNWTVGSFPDGLYTINVSFLINDLKIPDAYVLDLAGVLV